MNHKDVLTKAGSHLRTLKGKIINVVEVKQPPTVEYTSHLAKVISKLSPLVGNMIEFNACIELNKLDWSNKGVWKRQDPGFPDTIFEGQIKPIPGIEIKTWFPLATEITARFKDSISHFKDNQTDVALVAWMPEYIVYGKPKIIDILVVTASSIAKARDKHYHSPPDYLVFEPEDTKSRTANLQQTNTNGYKFQGNTKDFGKAEKLVKSWGTKGKDYSTKPTYQKKLKELISKFPYRLDTNYAKIDRIQHKELEKFKSTILGTRMHGYTLKQWSKMIADKEKNTLILIKDLM